LSIYFVIFLIPFVQGSNASRSKVQGSNACGVQMLLVQVLKGGVELLNNFEQS